MSLLGLIIARRVQRFTAGRELRRMNYLMFRILCLILILPYCLWAQQHFSEVVVSNAVVYGSGAVNETSGGGSIPLLGDFYFASDLAAER